MLVSAGQSIHNKDILQDFCLKSTDKSYRACQLFTNASGQSCQNLCWFTTTTDDTRDITQAYLLLPPKLWYISIQQHIQVLNSSWEFERSSKAVHSSLPLLSQQEAACCATVTDDMQQQSQGCKCIFAADPK